jgi:hypothetical protein
MASNETIERTQQEIVSANKDRLYQATKKDTEIEKVKSIFKNSSGLDNISKDDMQTFRSFMLR